MKTYGSAASRGRRWAVTGEILKVTDGPDGSLEVEGVASTPSRDSDGERITSAAMAEAIGPDSGFWKFPALRVQHEPIPAGRVLDASMDSEGRTLIRAVVVQTEAVRLVKAGVLRAFSVAGTVRRRNAADPSIIEALALKEISLVDIPANKDAIVTSAKGDAKVTAAAVVALDDALARAGASPEVAAAVRADLLDPEKLAADRARRRQRQILALGKAAAAPTPEAQGGTVEPPPEPGKCTACGEGLTCPKCTAAEPDPEEVERVAKMADTIGKLQGERDAAIRKARAMAAERDAVVKKLAQVGRERDGLRKSLDETRGDLDAAHAELRKRVKGSLKDVRGFIVEKTGDVSRIAAPDVEEPDAQALIKQAHRRPMPMAGDGGPLHKPR